MKIKNKMKKIKNEKCEMKKKYIKNELVKKINTNGKKKLTNEKKISAKNF